MLCLVSDTLFKIETAAHYSGGQCCILATQGAALSKVPSLGMGSLPWASFQRSEHNAFDFDSRFLVASRPVPDLLLFAKHLFVGAMFRKTATFRQPARR